MGLRKKPALYAYGYSKDKKDSLIINEKEAETARKVYTAYLEGKSLGEIVDMLFALNIPSPSWKEKWNRAPTIHEEELKQRTMENLNLVEWDEKTVRKQVERITETSYNIIMNLNTYTITESLRKLPLRLFDRLSGGSAFTGLTVVYLSSCRFEFIPCCGR